MIYFAGVIEGRAAVWNENCVLLDLFSRESFG